jgi:hypothetical protein
LHARWIMQQYRHTNLYLIPIAFPLQLWLRERPSVLPHMYIVYLVPVFTEICTTCGCGASSPKCLVLGKFLLRQADLWCVPCYVSGYLASSVAELNQKLCGGQRAGAISTSWRLAFDVALLYLLYSKREIIMVYGKPVRSLKCDELRSAGECVSFIF